MNVFLKITGAVLLVSGCIFTYKPNLVSKIPLPKDPYQMIEMRVLWGFLIGLGIFFSFHEQWNALKLTACSLLFCLTLGIIIARLFGFILDGYFSKQLLWLITEIIVLIIFGILYTYADH